MSGLSSFARACIRLIIARETLDKAAISVNCIPFDTENITLGVEIRVSTTAVTNHGIKSPR